ncbi:DNA gyrase subunit A [Actinopolyspora alba]|uniref:DNA gyrase subunit A n=1 Tax=Actinopolyspora alba TaxID=673379 RepID=A0A1I1VQL1_9ACTN|nr:intein-containing DNA gyrase subunit A [Actinopolyspora alba]SFD84318.1 DNA gyrase subunit A [Actinopolyspora alba]
MTETLPPEGGRVEPVDLQQEMQNSYIDYAMSVIVARALPDVRDGLKPVHRRVLYAMYDSGFRPDRSYVKCSRVVGDVMGNYHPHGDSAIYDTLVRMAQPWSMRNVLIDGQGNFGSPGNDPAAAMRYCVTGDTLVKLADGSSARIGDIVPDARPNSDNDIDLKVLGRSGDPVRAEKLFHSGEHPTLRLRTKGGYELTGTYNHPVLCLTKVLGVPTLLWKLLEEIGPGDHVVMQRSELSQGEDDHVPYVADYIRERGAERWTERDWLRRHNVDRIERWETDRAEITSRITDPEVLDVVEPLVDGRFYYAEVESVTDVGPQPVYSLRVDSDDHSFVTNGFVSHNTESRLAPLAMSMLAEIEEDTVEFSDNYDGRTQEPDVLPSRIPNLLVNGGGGIAVGMATNIPPHNLREVADGVVWALDNPEATDDELLEAMIERIKGPDFPTHAMIMGTNAIADAYRTGRGSLRMRAVVDVEEDAKGRTSLVVTELPYQVNPDNLIENIATMHREGKISGITDIADESNSRRGMRIVVTLKRDAIPKVVLNNLYKHTQLQTTFGVNMLALVDGVPRTLRLDQVIRYYVRHQIDVIVRRTRHRLQRAERRAHILRGLTLALDQLDAVINLIRGSSTVDDARSGLIELLGIDEDQATAILDMQLRKLAALERQKLLDELAEIEAQIADLNDILVKPERQRLIVRDELMEIVHKHGEERRTRIVPYEGEVSMEDLIADEDVVVTITRTGYAKRTRTDLYRAQKRGGKGVQGAALKQDDIVSHFFVCSTHDWILFFTNKGRVYRAKAYELPEANRTARGQHVANLLAFQPDEHIAQVMQIKDYTVSPYLVLATKNGLVKKSKLTDFDSNRSGGLIGVNLKDGDELVGAVLCSPEDDLLLVSAEGQSIRFNASDEVLRPMGRATSGVLGMRFNSGDELLAMGVCHEDRYVLVATQGGYAKRTPIDEYPVQGRGGKGVLTIQHDQKRGRLVAALIAELEDELYAITSTGGVIRTTAKEVRKAGRQTKGVRLMDLGEGNSLVAIARNADEAADPDAAGPEQRK